MKASKAFTNRIGALLLTALVALACARTVSAAQQEPVYCVVCGKGPLSGTIWKHRHGTFCAECKARPERCDHCGLPILNDFLKTKDGRYICKFEKDEVVVDEQQAKLIFNQSVKSVLYLTRNVMRLKGPAPDVRLFDIDYWNENSSMRRGGFSQTRQVGNNFTHNVILLSGLPKDELVTVCAHEYTHLWINENKESDREIEFHTIEAICELVGYLVAQRAGFDEQLERIKKNPYTKGRIDELLEANRQYGIFKVLEWVRTGQNARVSLAGGSVSASSSGVTPPPAPAPTPKGASASGAQGNGLKLTSITRTAKGYRAEINGVQIYGRELKRIAVNGRPANLQCHRVTADSALVTVNRGTPVELKLSR
jgi:hypothetical protein